MLTIISFTICPFVQRVTALLEAKQLPYRVEYISLSNKPQWFLERVPTGQVPVLITEDDQTLFESDAIVEYIDEIAEPLEPQLSPEQRALDRAWSYQASKHYLVQCSAQRSADRETLMQRSEKLAVAFARAEQQLQQREQQGSGSFFKGEGSFFKGESLSNVDIAWLPLLHRAAIIEQHSGYDFLQGFENVKAWQQALLATGLAARSVSEQFEQAFTDFYLSEQTYLGAGQNCSGPGDCGTQCC